MKSLPVPSVEFVLRLSLTGLLAGVAHQFQWIDLRFLTSEIILCISRLLGMNAERTSFDTIEVQGHLVQFVVACTFAELMIAIQPLLWRRDIALLRNLTRIALSIGALFSLNILRVEIAQILFSLGTRWVLAHDIPLGVIYFGIWVAVWRNRKWRALRSSPRQLARGLDDAAVTIN